MVIGTAWYLVHTKNSVLIELRFDLRKLRRDDPDLHAPRFLPKPQHAPVGLFIDAPRLAEIALEGYHVLPTLNPISVRLPFLTALPVYPASRNGTGPIARICSSRYRPKSLASSYYSVGNRLRISSVRAATATITRCDFNHCGEPYQ